MNNANLIGRLTKDPELRKTANGTSVCNFTIAVDRRFKSDGQPDADFIPVVAWSKSADFVSEWFSKGLRVGVTGRIQTKNWEDADGKKHYGMEVVAETLDFADGKREGSGGRREREDSYEDDDAPF